MKNLTIDMTRLNAMPLQQRVTMAKSGAASDIFGNLTPTQIADLFPKYYREKLPDISGFIGGATSGRALRDGDGSSMGGGGRYGSRGSRSGGSDSATPYTPPSVGQQLANAAGLDQAGASVKDPRVKRILQMVSKAEGTTGGYDTQYGYQNKAREAAGGKPLTQMTINEVRDLMMNTPKDHRAMGKYQFVPSTFNEVASQMGLSGNELFSPEMQDKMIVHRLNVTRGMDSFLSGKISKEQFSENLSMEFASFPSIQMGGNARYGGVGQNTSEARIPVNEVLSTLDEAARMEMAEPVVPTNPHVQDGTDIGITDLIPGGENRSADVTPQPFTFDPSQLNPVLLKEYETASPEDKKLIERAIEKKGYEWANNFETRNPTASPVSVVDGVINLGNVTEKQQEVAGVRRGDIKHDLKESLSYAAEQAGDDRYNVEVVVTSGGQRMEGAEGATGSHRHDDGGAADVNAYLVNKETNEKILLDPRNAEHVPYISKMTQEFARVHPNAGVGALYMNDPTKIHYGGDDVSEHGGRARGPLAYAGPEWFRESHQQGLVQREHDLEGGRNVIDEWRQAKIEQAADTIKPPSASPATEQVIPVNPHVVPATPDVPANDIAPTDLIPGGEDQNKVESPAPATNQAAAPETPIQKSMKSEVAEPYEDLTTKTVPKLSRGGTIPGEDFSVIDNRTGEKKAEVMANERMTTTPRGLQVESAAKAEAESQLAQNEVGTPTGAPSGAVVGAAASPQRTSSGSVRGGTDSSTVAIEALNQMANMETAVYSPSMSRAVNEARFGRYHYNGGSIQQT